MDQENDDSHNLDGSVPHHEARYPCTSDAGDDEGDRRMRRVDRSNTRRDRPAAVLMVGTRLRLTVRREQARAALVRIAGLGARRPGLRKREHDRRRLEARAGARATVARLVEHPIEVQHARGQDTWLRAGDARIARSVIRRADQIAAALREGPSPGDPLLERVRALVDRPMTVAEAVSASQAGDRGYRAVVRLIADGVLRMRDGWAIAPEKTVEPVADGCPLGHGETAR